MADAAPGDRSDAAPVLVVVFVTMLINVLKIFDIILNMAAPSSQAGAATLAVDIYNNFSTADRPGARRRPRRGAVHPRHPRHAVQPQEDPRMSVQAASLPVAAQLQRGSGVSACARRASSSTSSSRRSRSSGWCPSIGIAIISLRPNSAFEQSGWWTVFTAPAQLTFSNYQQLFSAGFKAGGVLDSLTTSIAITVPVTILVTVISSLTAYSLVFGRWRGRTLVFLLIVAMLVLPLQMALIPVASLYKIVDNATGLQLFGSVIGAIIFHVAFGLPFGIFLMRNFYSGIPHDLLEAGRIDGAGEWTLFRKVVMPIGIPALASLAIFQFIWVWNDLLVALIFLSGNTHQTLTLFLYGQTRALVVQLLDHLHRGDDLDHHPADRVLCLPAIFRPRRARRGGEMRSVSWPA